ncbi:MAG: InlB B-repeat-containing protein, partial [Bacteroidaceae bacterium]|nr:InlB B-repeat-containing protein [Bacteroidaceae bacterium]
SEIPETMPAKDVEIVGSFRANKYQLTYVVDGVVFHSDSIVYGSKLAAIDEPEKEGHTFCGWSEMPETMPARDVTISGSFTINKYLVMFVADEQVVYSDSLEYGSPIVIPDAPNKEGHTFKGWGDVEETVPAFDVTYRANYVVNVYKVYYYVGEKLVHTEEVAYSDEIPEYVYIPENEDEEFVGWIGEVYSTMPAHDLVYVANINTGIGEVETESGERKSKIFDLSGRRVKDVQKGIYIVNGKKVMM